MWAQVPNAEPESSNLDLWLTVGALLAVVALGTWAIHRVKCWRDQAATETALTPQEQLDHYQKMVDDGFLEPQEFAVIKARLETPPAPEATKPIPHQPPDTSIQEK